MLLAKHPDIQQKLYEDVITTYTKYESQPFDLLISKLTYCQHVINETLRLYPTVPIFTRLSSFDETVGDYTVKAMVCLFVCSMIYTSCEILELIENLYDSSPLS